MLIEIFNIETKTEKKQLLLVTVTVQICFKTLPSNQQCFEISSNNITTGDIGSLKDHDAIILR